MACAVLAANLGSRAWHYLKLQPLEYSGIGAPILAFLAAIVTGIVVPYMGYRQVEAGGKAALETVLRSAFLVAIVFLVSDIDDVQKFIIVGSEECNQDSVNVAVGIWWSVSLLISIFFVLNLRPYFPVRPEDEEPILIEDHASPVGFKVPNLPDVPIYPSLVDKGSPFCTLTLEVLIGIVLAFVGGFAMVSLPFTDLDDKYT